MTRTYAASAESFGNSERGFYHYSETHLSGTGSASLDVAALARARTQDGVTLVFRYYYLDVYRDRDSITPSDSAVISQDLQAVRAAGLKVVIRFAYSSSSSADAPEPRVLQHIAQIAPILNASADVLEAV